MRQLVCGCVLGMAMSLALSIFAQNNTALTNYGLNVSVVTPVLTVSTLPPCNANDKGKQAAVSDATTPTYLGTLTGGGAVFTPVVCNGTAWVSY